MYNANNVKGNEAESIDLCLQLLGTNYIDLLLIHNPTTQVPEYNAATLPHFFELFNHSGDQPAIKPEKLPDGTKLRDLIINAKMKEAFTARDSDFAFETRKKSWQALERAKEQGKCRYIGVSNYPSELLLEMKQYAKYMPAVNECELSPRYSTPALREVCKELGIVMMAYGTGNYTNINPPPVLEEIAKKVGKSTLSVVLRWTTQLGVAVIPRSRSKGHLKDNLEMNFHLSDEDMEALNALNEDYPYYWDMRASVGSFRDKYPDPPLTK